MTCMFVLWFPALIYYTGHGQEGTGNWCFKDGFITFEEIFDLYKRHFRGKLLYLLCDCCYSGQWIQRCGEALDSMSIGACGHQARKHDILIKISTACLPSETAWDTHYSSQGVTLRSDGRLIFYTGKDIGKDIKKDIGTIHYKQTTLFMDFTKARCYSKTEDSCRLPSIPLITRWSWKELTSEDKKKDHLLEYIVRGKNKERQCWHAVIVVDSKLKKFKAAMGSRYFDVADYGHVIFSGWGKDPPEKTDKLLGTYGPTSGLVW